MKTVIENGNIYRKYLLCLYGVIFLMMTVIIIYNNLLSIVTALCLIIIVLDIAGHFIIHPKYFYLLFKNSVILIKTSWDSDNFIEIRLAEYAGFKTIVTVKNLKKSLIIYKKVNGRLMATKEISITLLTKQQLFDLLTLLNSLKH